MAKSSNVAKSKVKSAARPPVAALKKAARKAPAKAKAAGSAKKPTGPVKKLKSAARAVAKKPVATKGKKKKLNRAAKKGGLATFDQATLKKIARDVERWAAEDLARITSKMPLRKEAWATDSGIPIPDVVTLADRKNESQDRIGLPGQFPFTRGVQPTMYRGRLWTMRQFAGFGTPKDTNERFKYLLSQGRPASRPPSTCPR